MNPITVPLDVAGPGFVAVLGAGIGLAVVLLAVVVLIEAVVLRQIGWGTLWRSLLASLLMNVASSILGLFFISLSFVHPVVWLLLAFVLSVLVEGGVLLLMDRAKASRGFFGAFVANVVTYLPLAGLLWWGLRQ